MRRAASGAAGGSGRRRSAWRRRGCATTAQGVIEARGTLVGKGSWDHERTSGWPMDAARHTVCAEYGMSMWTMSEGAERVDDGVHDGGRAADRARLAGVPLTPIGLTGDGVTVSSSFLEVRQPRGARHRVVLHRARDRSWQRPRRIGPPSQSACPTPWAIPPWSWPSTIIGLIFLPTSSTATYLLQLDDTGSPRRPRRGPRASRTGTCSSAGRSRRCRRGTAPSRRAGRRRPMPRARPPGWS